MATPAPVIRISATPEQRQNWHERSLRLSDLARGWATRSDAEWAPRFAALHARLSIRYARLVARSA